MRPVKNTKRLDPMEGTGLHSILAVGGIGRGKTTALRTLPGRKFLYVFDPNAVKSLEGDESIDYVEFIPDHTDIAMAVQSIASDPAKARKVKPRDVKPKTYTEFEDDYHDRVDSKFFADYDWIAFDSITSLLEIIMDRLLWINRRVGKQPQQDDWAGQINTMKNLFRVAAHPTMGCNIFATAHTDLDRDELSGAIYGKLLVTGRLRVRLPMLFSDIFEMEAYTSKGKAAFTVRTKPDRRHPVVRTTLKECDLVEDVTVDWTKDPVGQGLGRLFKRENMIWPTLKKVA